MATLTTSQNRASEAMARAPPIHPSVMLKPLVREPIPPTAVLTPQEADKLFETLRRPVVLNSDQTPQFADIRNAGYDGGEFIFVRRPAAN